MLFYLLSAKFHENRKFTKKLQETKYLGSKFYLISLEKTITEKLIHIFLALPAVF